MTWHARGLFESRAIEHAQSSPSIQIMIRVRRRCKEGVKAFLHERIAFATRGFESGPIEHLYPPSSICDQPRCLQRLRAQRYRLTIGAQHVCQKLMSVSQGFAFGSIMHHEQPTAHSLLRGVHGIAGHALLHLRQKGFGIAHEQIAHPAAVIEFVL